jgi:hypothetical protein
MKQMIAVLLLASIALNGCTSPNQQSEASDDEFNGQNDKQLKEELRTSMFNTKDREQEIINLKEENAKLTDQLNVQVAKNKQLTEKLDPLIMPQHSQQPEIVQQDIKRNQDEESKLSAQLIRIKTHQVTVGCESSDPVTRLFVIDDPERGETRIIRQILLAPLRRFRRFSKVLLGAQNQSQSCQQGASFLVVGCHPNPQVRRNNGSIGFPRFSKTHG